MTAAFGAFPSPHPAAIFKLSPRTDRSRDAGLRGGVTGGHAPCQPTREPEGGGAAGAGEASGSLHLPSNLEIDVFWQAPQTVYNASSPSLSIFWRVYYPCSPLSSKLMQRNKPQSLTSKHIAGRGRLKFRPNPESLRGL